MPRKRRDDFSGAWHHVMNRGRNRDIIFRDDDDAVLFLDILKGWFHSLGKGCWGKGCWGLIIVSFAKKCVFYMREKVGVVTLKNFI